MSLGSLILIDVLNISEIPAAELQGLFFDINRPSYVNYGSMGTVIGHEIAHAMSYNSRKNDKIGYLNDWWTNETDKKYRDKAQCFVDQYSNYTIEGLDQKVTQKLIKLLEMRTIGMKRVS